MRIDEDRLAHLLRAEADTVQPAGDGLARIQQRVGARRARLRWLRPVVAFGAAAAVVGGVLAGVAATGGSNGSPQRIVVPPASHAPAPQKTSGLVGLWRATNGNAQQAAVGFTQFLFAGMNEQFRAIAHHGKATDQHVTVGYASEGGRYSPAAVVHVVHRSDGWEAVGTDDTTLTLTTPAYGATVSSPVAVGGRITGVDESIHVQVRQASAQQPLGDACCLPAGGTNAPWSTTVSYSGASTGPLTIVAWTGGHLQPVERFAVTAIRAGKSTAHYPSTFAALAGHRVGIYSSTTGGRIRTLARNGASDVQVTDDGKWVYYDVFHSDCHVDLMRVPYAGGTPHGVVTGHEVMGFAVARGGNLLAYTEHVGCNVGTSQLVTENVATGQRHVLPFPASPPLIEGNPAWSPDGTHVAAVVRTGMAAQIEVYDAFTATSWDDGTTVPTSPAGLPTAVGYDAAGNLEYVVQTGRAAVVHQVSDGHDRVLFRMPNGSATLSVAADGSVLAADTTNGVQVWRWSPGSSAVRLPTAALIAAAW